MKIADPDILIAADGHLYVNAASLRLANRTGRRVVRCVSLTPGEEEELRRRIGEITADLLVALPGKRGKAR
jgi:hypothetical protein